MACKEKELNVALGIQLLQDIFVNSLLYNGGVIIQ